MLRWFRLVLFPCALAWAGVSVAGGETWALPGRHIPAIDGARRLQMSPAGDVLFVGGARAGQLIRGWQGSALQVRVIRVREGVEGGAGGSAFSGDGKKLYWAEGDLGIVSIFSTESGQRVGELRVGQIGEGVRRAPGRFGEMAMRADGGVLFVMDPANHRVLGVEPEGGRVLGTMTTGRLGTVLMASGGQLFGTESEWGSVGAGGTLWAADVEVAERPVVTERWEAHRIWEVLGAGAQKGQKFAADDFVADAKSLYAVRTDANAVVRIDLRSRRVAAWRVMTGTGEGGAAVGTGPRGLALAPGGDRLYVAEAGLNAIGVLDGRSLAPLGHVATPGYPFRVVVSPDGARLACLSLEGLPVIGGAAEDAEGVVENSVSARPVVTVLEVPSAGEMAAGSQRVLARAGVVAMNSRGATHPIPDTGNQSGTGSVTNGNGASTRPLAPMLLPIEVLGAGGTREEARLTLTGLEALKARTLCLTVHGVQYEDKAKVTINGRHTVSINNQTVRVMGNAKRYGGIGGGYHTVPMELDLPKGVLQEGENLLVFEYTRKGSYAVSGFQLPENRIDDASSGFRVVRINLQEKSGKVLLGAERFVDDDPRMWGPPEVAVDLAQAIHEGELLWRGLRSDGTPFRLKNSSEIGLTPPEMKATCADCHVQDGRDLKYYNYSNRSIITRSMIHGLTEEEGRWIAAYIRTLSGAPVVPQARPWNPPFQPGPGLDSRPVYEWAAGAGIDAVLEDPVETFNGIFPGAYRKNEIGEAVWDLTKITTDPIQPRASLSIREVRVAMQLMDWNHWLPKVHPMDGYADVMETNATLRAQIDGYQKAYDNIVTFIRTPSGLTNYGVVQSFSRSAQAAMSMARSSYPFNRVNHTLKEAQRRYPFMLLPLVKGWEIYMEFGFGDRMAQLTCGPRADERSWRLGMAPFGASPNIAGLLDTREEGVPYEPRNGHGIGNNKAVTFNYISSAWYHLQLILDHGNRNPGCGVNVAAPFDWPYVMAHLWDLQGEKSTGASLSMMPVMYLSLAKAPQIYDTGLGVEYSQSGGWQPYMVMPHYLQVYSYGTDRYRSIIWKDIPPAAQARLMEVLYRVWLDKNLESNPEQYQVPVSASQPTLHLGFVKPGRAIGGGPNESLADRMHFVLAPRASGFDGSLNGFGVSSELQNELIDWAKTIWPMNGDGTIAGWDTFRPSAQRR